MTWKHWALAAAGVFVLSIDGWSCAAHAQEAYGGLRLGAVNNWMPAGQRFGVGLQGEFGFRGENAGISAILGDTYFSRDGAGASQGSLLGAVDLIDDAFSLRLMAGFALLNLSVGNESITAGTGYTAGIGASYAIQRPWGLGVEYRYSEFSCSPEFAYLAGFSQFGVGQLAATLNVVW